MSSGPTWEDLLRVGPTDRVLLLGQTGMGKTRCLRTMLRLRAHQVVIETKWDPEGPHTWPGYETVADLRALTRLAERPQDHPKIVYQVPHDLYEQVQRTSARTDLDVVFDWIMQRRATTLAIDEGADLTNEGTHRMPYTLRKVLREGRASVVSTFIGSQRPVGIDRLARNQAQHIFVFYMSEPDDVQVTAKMTGLSIEEILSLPPYHFYRFSVPRTVSGPWHLTFPSRGN